MRNLFERTSSHWVRYSAYEWKKDKQGTLYLTVAEGAKPEIYDPLKDAQTLVLDALNIGRLCMSKQPDNMKYKKQLPGLPQSMVCSV